MTRQDVESYTRLFGGPGMPFITSYLFGYYYRQIEMLITWNNHHWTAFLTNDWMERTLQEGVKFYSDSKAVATYKKDYKKHYEESLPFFEALVKKDQLTEDDIAAFFSYAGEVLSLYVKCEFFYTDRVFEVSKTNPTLKENLRDFDKLKNPGKEQIIRVFFDQHSYIYQVLEILSKQFNIPFEDLVEYKPEEIQSLFSTKQVSKELIEKRRRSYVFSSHKEIELDYDADEFIQKILPPIPIKNEIKGIPANKGAYTGTVKLFDHGYEFYKVGKMMDEMKQGQVLVTETTSPELMLACKKAGAIVTNEGGLLSHAAIVARELDIPCIVAAHGVTTSFKDGDKVHVDATKGIIKRL